MKNFVHGAVLAATCFAGSSHSFADLIEIIESDGTSQYCVPQTQVRGEFDNVILDHNMIIEPDDHFKKGDIFIGARLKSQPDVLWLSKGGTWRKINTTDDLRNSQYQGFDSLPLVAPVSIFYSPVDVTELIDDVEIWVGYGLRSATESAVDSFNEMTASGRYRRLWVALPPPYRAVSGVIDPYADLCFETTSVMKVVRTAELASESGQ